MGQTKAYVNEFIDDLITRLPKVVSALEKQEGKTINEMRNILLKATPENDQEDGALQMAAFLGQRLTFVCFDDFLTRMHDLLECCA